MTPEEQLKDDRAFYFDFIKAQVQVIALTHTNESRLEKELRVLDERFVRVASERKKYPLLAKGDSARTVAFFFPSVMIVAWVVLLAFYLL